MKLVFNIFIIFTIFLFSGCTSKITMKALQSSQIEKEKVNSIVVQKFINDDINQTENLASKMANYSVDGKQVFTLKNDIFGTDAILTGEILNSSANYNVYYRSEVDYSRCRYYRYNERQRIRQCIDYYVRYIPCESKQYNVTTAINLIKPVTNQVIFSKTYSKTANDDVCYDPPYYSKYMPSSLNANSDRLRVNSQLANEISDDILDDISPHYIYFEVELLKDLGANDNLVYTKAQEESFENSIKLIENGNLDMAKYNLETLNQQLNGKNTIVLYNLAVIYEATNNLKIANDLYNQIKTSIPINDLKILDLVEYGIVRTNINLEEKIKAKSQLP